MGSSLPTFKNRKRGNPALMMNLTGLGSLPQPAGGHHHLPLKEIKNLIQIRMIVMITDHPFHRALKMLSLVEKVRVMMKIWLDQALQKRPESGVLMKSLKNLRPDQSE